MTAILGIPTAAQASPALVLFEDPCFADPGDVPGLPGFQFDDSVVVITSSGVLKVTCVGDLPEDLSVDETFAGPVPCVFDADTVVEGRITATKSGRVSVVCVFPRGTLVFDEP